MRGHQSRAQGALHINRSLLSVFSLYARAAQGYSEMGKKGGSATATGGSESTDDLKEEACPRAACAALTDVCRVSQIQLYTCGAAVMRHAC